MCIIVLHFPGIEFARFGGLHGLAVRASRRLLLGAFLKLQVEDYLMFLAMVREQRLQPALVAFKIGTSDLF